MCRVVASFWPSFCCDTWLLEIVAIVSVLLCFYKVVTQLHFASQIFAFKLVTCTIYRQHDDALVEGGKAAVHLPHYASHAMAEMAAMAVAMSPFVSVFINTKSTAAAMCKGCVKGCDKESCKWGGHLMYV